MIPKYILRHSQQTFEINFITICILNIDAIIYCIVINEAKATAF